MSGRIANYSIFNLRLSCLEPSLRLPGRALIKSDQCASVRKRPGYRHIAKRSDAPNPAVSKQIHPWWSSPSGIVNVPVCPQLAHRGRPDGWGDQLDQYFVRARRQPTYIDNVIVTRNPPKRTPGSPSSRGAYKLMPQLVGFCDPGGARCRGMGTAVRIGPTELFIAHLALGTCDGNHPGAKSCAS
jgi:hypothetical protein